jgi:hypothetical protein
MSLRRSVNHPFSAFASEYASRSHPENLVEDVISIGEFFATTKTRRPPRNTRRYEKDGILRRFISGFPTAPA